MKLSKLSQLVLVSAIGLVLATFLTACNLVTIDYLFVASSAGSSSGSTGQIYTYAVDGNSGALRSAASPVSSGGSGPVAMATTSDYYNLYVANKGNNSVVHFSVSDHGILIRERQHHACCNARIACRESSRHLFVRRLGHQFRHAH